VEIFNEKFDAVVVLDPWWVDIYRSCGVKTPIFVLPAGLDIDEYFKMPDRIYAQTPFTFGTTGAFWDRKNHQVLLRAFEEEFGDSTDVRLILHGRYGQSHIIDSLVHTVLHHHMPNVFVYQGLLNKDDYLKFMGSLDCYVLISLGEGYSISPREAMALGIPCILSENTAHITLCQTGLVRPVPCELKVSADREPYGGADVGKMFDCSVAEVRKALREVYENYIVYLRKAKKSRTWVKQCTFESLKPLYLALLKPSKVVLGKENKLEPGCLTTDSEALYHKYQKLILVAKQLPSE
jgi:glycosyltransferase involved in cell wall biosynthesis